MRLSLKIGILLALAALALASLSCEAVNRLAQDTPTSPLVFKPDQLPDAQVGKDYSVRVTVEGSRTPVGAFSLQDGQLPPGLALKKVAGVENTAEISGTPTQAGTYQFVIYVWCYGTQRSGQTGQKEYSIVVK